MLSKRSFGVVSVAVQMSNPNGRIEDGSPRIVPSTGCGWISPYRTKREIRNQFEDHTDPAVLELFDELKIDKNSRDNFHVFESRLKGFVGVNDLQAKKKALELFKNDEGLPRYADVRMFGGTLLEKESSNGADDATAYTKTGAVQISPLVSVLPVNVIISGLSKKTPLDEKHLTGGQSEGTGTFGNSAIKLVEHGIYYGFYCVSASEASKTKMTDTDLELLKKSIPMMFSRHSAQQVGVNVVQAIHITHNNIRGSFNEFKLIDMCRPRAKSDPTRSSSSFDDYGFVNLAKIEEFLGKQGTVEVLTSAI